MDLFQLHCKCLLLPIPEKEVKFCPTRRWRADYFFANAVSGKPLAVEIEGGIFTKGRHTRGKGAENDMAKYNEMAIMGIALLRFTPEQVKRGLAALSIQRWFYANIKA